MDKISSSSTSTYAFNLEHFRIRLTARLCTIVACLVLLIPRIPAIIADPGFTSKAQLFFILSLPFPLLMPLVITFEYFLYKKLGPGIVKYSGLVDFMLLIFFMGDWIMILIGSISKIQQTNPVSFKIGALYGFTSFSWRTLMVTMIVQKWQLKIIAPCIAVMTATGYAVYYSPGTTFFTLLTAATQLFNVILIIYCEDKFKWKMIWAIIQKEKWMQVNNFILDSLPENIMIIDLNGETKFINEYYQSFIMKCHLSLDPKDLFKRVQDLQQQQLERSEPESPAGLQIERLKTEDKFMADKEKHPEDISKKQILEDVISMIKNTIENKEIKEREFLVYNGKLKIEDQQDKSLEVKISFVQHFENYYIILIIRDTTQRDLLVTLEETNKYKDQLLASVSHELRGPLNGNINLVESAVNSPKILECVKEALLIPALRSSQFLLHLVNDILDMSQIKEKKLRLAFQSGNLQDTLKSTAQLVELQAKKKGIELLLDIDLSLPKTFFTDHIRLSQIVLNLLNNAIKFTQKGTVKLIAEPIPSSSSVKIFVEDSGIGMSQENVDKLFSSYTHIEFEGRQSINPTGVGLGLNIAYNLAILLGPRNNQGITVTSTPGQGSIFTFILENKEQKCSIELQSADNSNDSCIVADELGSSKDLMSFPRLNRITNGSSNSITPIIERCGSSIYLNDDTLCTCPKVLVVDDNPFNTMACETIFGSLGIKCESVYNGSACIKTLLNRQATKPCGENCKQYDVVLMDQEMPEMSGSETVKEILKLQSQSLLSANIKIIGCTAHKSKEEVDKFMEAGIEKCIHKPISAVVIKDIFKGTN